jgi:ABC transporter
VSSSEASAASTCWPLHAKNLSGGQQKLLELGRCLMLEPTVLFLDEPFAGVHPQLRDELIKRIQELHANGRTFVVVDHDMESILRISQRLGSWPEAARSPMDPRPKCKPTRPCWRRMQASKVTYLGEMFEPVLGQAGEVGVAFWRMIKALCGQGWVRRLLPTAFIVRSTEEQRMTAATRAPASRD